MNRRFKLPGRDILGYLFLGISIIMLGKSLMLCFSSDIWYDELFTVGMIEHSYGDLIAFTARDVHPPLYYCIVKFILELCKLITAQTNAVVIAKVVSVLPYFILLIYSVTFIRRRFGIFTGGLFLFCVIAMPQLSAYTVEVRMYSWALLFVTAAFLHAYGTITAQNGTVVQPMDRLRADGSTDGGREAAGRDGAVAVRHTKGRHMAACVRAHMRQIHGAALVCYGLAAAYTQYFACVAVIMVYLYALIVFFVKERGRIKEWLLWAAISVVGYIPWLYALVGQITAVRENYWILPLTWRSLGGCVKFVMKPAFTNEILNVILAVVMFAICGFVFSYGLIKVCHYSIEKYKNAQNKVKFDSEKMILSGMTTLQRFSFAVAGAGVLIGLAGFGFVASVLVRPIFVYRYMISALGCFWLGFAVACNEIWGKKDLCKPEGKTITDQDIKIDDGTGKECNQKRTKACGKINDKAYEKISEKACRWSKKNTFKLIFTAATICLLVIGLRDYRAFMGEEEYKIRLMQETESALSSIAAGDIVIYNFDQVQAVTSYYMDEATESYLWCGTPEALIQEIFRPYGTVEQTAQIQTWVGEGRTVWFAGSFNSREDVIAEWEAAGLHVEETGSYLLERYWFNLYKIN